MTFFDVPDQSLGDERSRLRSVCQCLEPAWGMQLETRKITMMPEIRCDKEQRKKLEGRRQMF
jgi:hypothetical protein